MSNIVLDDLSHYMDATARYRQALREISEYEPQRHKDETLSGDIAACGECARRRARKWPPSGLCEDHYRRMARIEDRNKDEAAAQHYAMREIARKALANES